jgi:hypothetical protein
MEIKYLKILEENPAYTYSDGSVDKLKPISIDEIKELETRYNNDNTFPAALKELLYLAGECCYVMDYVNSESQDDLQQMVREYLVENNMKIDRPFYAVEIMAGSFLFMYLDENKDDPDLYRTDPFSCGEEKEIRKRNSTLSELINARMVRQLNCQD